MSLPRLFESTIQPFERAGWPSMIFIGVQMTCKIEGNDATRTVSSHFVIIKAEILYNIMAELVEYDYKVYGTKSQTNVE